MTVALSPAKRPARKSISTVWKDAARGWGGYGRKSTAVPDRRWLCGNFPTNPAHSDLSKDQFIRQRSPHLGANPYGKKISLFSTRSAFSFSSAIAFLEMGV
jgi:hypothetical protein